jgi:hypothetical protein
MSKITDEEKAVIIMTRAVLKIAIDNCTFRELFCYDHVRGIELDRTFDGDDCGCVITWVDDTDEHNCGCICHGRIRELDHIIFAVLEGMRMHQNSWFKNRKITGEKVE